MRAITNKEAELIKSKIYLACRDVDEHGYQLQETKSIKKQSFIKDVKKLLKIDDKSVVYPETFLYEVVSEYLTIKD